MPANSGENVNAQTNRYTPLYRALQTIGMLALPVFYLKLLKSPWIGYSDFDQMYMAGMAWRKRLSPYDGHLLSAFGVPNGPTNAMLHAYYYAPLCGMLLAPLSLLPFPEAILVWKLGTFTLLLYSFWCFLRVACAIVPLPIRWFLLGISALAGSVRWNVVQLQPTALIVAFLILFACAVIEGRQWRSILLGILISIKFTYMLPVVGLLLLCRQYRVLGITFALIVALNGLSLLQTGPTQTLVSFRNAFRTCEDPGKMGRPDALDFLTPYFQQQSNSPLARYAPKGRKPGEQAGEQIHFPFILSGLGLGDAASKAVGLLLSALLCGAVFLIGRKAQHLELAADSMYQGIFFAALLSVSLLVVYHQRYDAVALIPCVFVSVADLYRRKSLPAWITLTASVLLAYLLSGSLLGRWQERLVVPYGLLFLVPVCGYLTLIACLGTLSLLWQVTRNAATHSNSAAF